MTGRRLSYGNTGGQAQMYAQASSQSFGMMVVRREHTLRVSTPRGTIEQSLQQNSAVVVGERSTSQVMAKTVFPQTQRSQYTSQAAASPPMRQDYDPALERQRPLMLEAPVAQGEGGLGQFQSELSQDIPDITRASSQPYGVQNAGQFKPPVIEHVADEVVNHDDVTSETDFDDWTADFTEVSRSYSAGHLPAQLSIHEMGDVGVNNDLSHFDTQSDNWASGYLGGVENMDASFEQAATQWQAPNMNFIARSGVHDVFDQALNSAYGALDRGINSFFDGGNALIDAGWAKFDQFFKKDG